MRPSFGVIKLDKLTEVQLLEKKVADLEYRLSVAQRYCRLATTMRKHIEGMVPGTAWFTPAFLKQVSNAAAEYKDKC